MEKKQYLLSGLFIIMLVTIVLSMSTAMSNAGTVKFTKKPTISSSSMTMVKKPDLVIKNAAWSKLIKEGDIVGSSSILNITVLNRGNDTAGANKLRVTCKSLTGTNYPYPLNGQINIQPLGPGKSMTYAWPPSSSEKWFAGTYKLDFSVDYFFNHVAESNEMNNTRSLTFAVSAKTDFIKKIKAKKVVKPEIKAKPVAKPELIADLEVVSVSLSNDNPVAGEDVIITAKVRNSGAVNSPQVGSTFRLWDTHSHLSYTRIPTPPVPPLTPGQITELKIISRFIWHGQSSGVEVEIDKGNAFKETNENNNKKIHHFSVQCKPELAPYDGRKEKPANINGNTKPGEPFTTTIWVYNNGGCQSKPAVLAIQGIGLAFTSYDIPPIMATQKIGIPVSLKWTQPGTKNCEIKVDYTNTNSESIENNNVMKLIVNVLSGTWPEGE